jgi:hypothetical protein
VVTDANVRTGTYVAMCVVMAACTVIVTVVYVHTVREQTKKMDAMRDRLSTEMRPPQPPPAQTAN